MRVKTNDSRTETESYSTFKNYRFSNYAILQELVPYLKMNFNCRSRRRMLIWALVNAIGAPPFFEDYYRLIIVTILRVRTTKKLVQLPVKALAVRVMSYV